MRKYKLAKRDEITGRQLKNGNPLTNKRVGKHELDLYMMEDGEE